MAASAPGTIPLTVKLSFYIGSAAFFGAVLYTILTTKEHPPADMEAFRAAKAKSAGIAATATEVLAAFRAMPTTMKQLAPVQLCTWLGLFCMWLYFPVAVARNVGRKRALEMAMTGDAIDAATAVDWGLINKAVAPDQLEAATRDLIERATRGSALSKALGKQAFYRQVDLPQDEAAMMASNARVCAALYTSGMIYKEQLKDRENAIESFEVPALLGLPVGIQFSAANGAEKTLLEIAYEMEAAQPWIGRKPKVWAG